MAETLNPHLHNPHLNSDPIFFRGGRVGILLLHGFTATPYEVRPAAERLARLGYSVAGPCLPGHATRPEDLNRVRWQDWVETAGQAYRALQGECEKVVVGGESMGAVVALYLATQHPEAAAVLAFAPAIRLRLTWVRQLQLRLLAPVVMGVPKGGLDASENWQGYRVNPLRGVLQLLAMQRALQARLPLIQQPLFVGLGRFDTTIHPQAGEMVLKGVSSAIREMHCYEHSSHVVLLDGEIDAVITDVENFLRRVL
ncbi:MAG TPA: hypothetical protein DEQ80_08210 [Anaerolinea thermolimosa]|uniref:Esterase n=1 Tax=Anaerolinea thermolimosa TaxID=229919 RepID=A0A3D1JJ86_9CHLR|nr:alpha/beta fold hydrolase [Anaerolinea thermolimosa]GAP08558.1 esterase [Anaerolinea thermolimosa]HCE17828.1 hypothetical protein [Anaerolinea thermolimosa]